MNGYCGFPQPRPRYKQNSPRQYADILLLFFWEYLYVWKFQYLKQCKMSCYMCVNSTYYRPIATKLCNFIERNNLYHLANRMACLVYLIVNLCNPINNSDLINLKRAYFCV